MWNIKKQNNEQTTQKQTHRYKNILMAATLEGFGGICDKADGIKKYKLSLSYLQDNQT